MLHSRLTYRFLTVIAIMLAIATTSRAQEAEQFTIPSDTVQATLPETEIARYDSLYKEVNEDVQTLSPDSSRVALKRRETQNGNNGVKLWKPDPSKATWFALVFPGGGQIYNRKYWKLPIVYGGFAGCLYAYNWNGQMYKDYRQAYLDIMDSDPNTDSYKDFFRPGYDFEKNKDYLKEVFKKRKDRYRRWRDLSVFATIAVYALSVIDAYVDAQLSNFDITEDINLSIEPQRIKTGDNLINQDYYGLNFNITF